MTGSKINRLVAKASGKLSFRLILTVPFVLQIMIVVGLVGYLSFRNGQKAVEDLAHQLMDEISDRISTDLSIYLETPHYLNQKKRDLIELGLLNLDNLQPWEKYLSNELKYYEYINLSSVSNTNGRYATAVKLSDRSQRISICCSKMGITQMAKNFDMRQYLYKKGATRQGKATWSSANPSFLGSTPVASALLPVYDRKQQLQGVLVTALNLDRIGQFLSSLKIGKTGRIFIAYKDGRILASSTQEKILTFKNKEFNLLQVLKSRDPITRATAKYLINKFASFEKIDNLVKLDFDVNGKQHFLKAVAFKDNRGLDLVIVIVVPESDFMAHIHANTKTTIIICLICLTVVTIVCILTACWIVKPILKLNVAAKNIAEGKWEQDLDLERGDEVGQLARSFNLMMQKLQASFSKLEAEHNAAIKFVPQHFLNYLKKHSLVEIELGDRVRKQMAVMFSDMRCFTDISEDMTPQENFEFVNEYLALVSPKIRENDGFIVKYLGDGMMAIFPNSPDDAVNAAIAKLRQIEQYNIQRQAKGELPIQLGIGVHFGLMMVGIVGESTRMQGDVFSEDVNLAARLESLTKFYNVSLIISEEFLNNLISPEKYHVRFLDRVLIKGKKRPICIFEIFDGDGEKTKELKLKTLSDFQQAISYYHQQKLTDALSYFERVLDIYADDTIAMLYLERVKQLIEQGIPQNWSGIWIMSQK